MVFLDLVLLAAVGTGLVRLAARGGGVGQAIGVAALALSVVAWVSPQVSNIQLAPPVEAASGRILEEHYQGKTFATNAYAPLVSYYTRQWVLNVTVPHANYLFLPENVHDAIFPFQADYWTNPSKYERPQYYLCDSSSARANAPSSPDAQPGYCAHQARQMADYGHVPEALGDYYAIVRLTYS
jgi:hypothetical protein